jgi:diacylglycerol kinase (ATP)
MTFVLQGKSIKILKNNSAKFFSKDVGDKLIEVVGVQSAIHAGSIYAGVRSSAKRLGQCSSVVIR